MNKNYLIIGLVLVLSAIIGLNAQGLPNKVYNSSCMLPLDLKTATVMDLNHDDHYESMQTIWCDLNNGNEITLMSPIIYPVEGSRGTPINDVAEEPLPWKKLRKQPKLTEFTLQFYISDLNPTVLYDYQMRETGIEVYYTQYVPWSDVEELSGTGISVSPNPASSNAGLEFNLLNDNQVTISLFSQSGQLVSMIDNSFRTAGDNSVDIKTNELASGVYFIQTIIGTQTFYNKLFVVK